jgi:hypothetical protein
VLILCHVIFNDILQLDIWTNHCFISHKTISIKYLTEIKYTDASVLLVNLDVFYVVLIRKSAVDASGFYIFHIPRIYLKEEFISMSCHVKSFPYRWFSLGAI